MTNPAEQKKREARSTLTGLAEPWIGFLKPSRRGWLSLALIPLVLATQGNDERVLDPGMVHLGDSPAPEWTEADPEPTPGSYSVVFEAEPNAVEHVLILAQRHVNDRWDVMLNGQLISELDRHNDLRDVMYTLPTGTLVRGENVLEVVPSTSTDDITIGRARLVSKTMREWLDLQPVDLTVIDGDTGKPIPARVTIVDSAGELPQLYYAQSERTAVRPGLLYLGEGVGHLELPRGQYTFWAARGVEWGLDEVKLDLTSGVGTAAVLTIHREVDTTGFVAADTHIHTVTYSGHGDASTEERMVTLAGEGVELPIATDHNHNTDYRPVQQALGMSRWFTPVTGNEVTASIGHFNAFPLDPDDEIPAVGSTDWNTLVSGMRSKGAQVVILNHPRWPAHKTGPYGKYELEVATGRRSGDVAFPFDAMELVNSQTVEEDPMVLFHDWFGLLNRGESITGVGSSDSHTVGGVVGGGRTYVPSATDDPAKIDVEAACEAFRAGQTSVSMGIFTDVRVNGGTMGDQVGAEGGGVEVSLRVSAPSWVRPRRALVFCNGEEVAAMDVPVVEGEPTDVTLDLPVQLASMRDAWLVCVVLGDGVGGPWFPLLNDYTLAATNPVFLDVDGDGQYSNPRLTAQAMLEADLVAGRELDGPQDCDSGIALQYLDLLADVLVERTGETLRRVGSDAAMGQAKVEDYLKNHHPVREH
jgi:hypothetical protein